MKTRTEDGREGEDLQINQDCQNSKLSGPPLVEQTEDQEENETEEMKNEIKMQRPEEMQRLEDQERLLDESEQMLAIDGEKKQGGQIGQPSSKSKNMTIANCNDDDLHDDHISDEGIAIVYQLLWSWL